MKRLFLLPVSVVILFLSGCGSSSVLQNKTTQATLWVQNAAEYRALTTQVYASALRSLPLAKEDSFWSASIQQEQNGTYNNFPPAIILDVDETILDNSPFQARMIKQNKSYNIKDWNKWVKEAKADAIAGALEFTNYADQQGIQVFYLTNREHSVEQATRDNLRKLGFPLAGGVDNILTKGEREEWTSSKENRRAFIARNYRILMLFGDDLNDFLPAKNMTGLQRNELVERYSDYFGRRWFILPNPVYGSWESALYDFNSEMSEEQRDKVLENSLRTKQNTP